MDTMSSYYAIKFNCFMSMKRDFETVETREEIQVILDYYGYTVKIDELKGFLLSLMDQLSYDELLSVMDEYGIDFEWYNDLFKLFKEVSQCLIK